MTQEMPPFQCDPTTKREIWLFQQIDKTKHGKKPIYKRLPYNLVTWDGYTTYYVEPASMSSFNKIIDGSGDPITPQTDGNGLVVGFQFFTSRPFDVFGINDMDYANNLGMLT